MTQPTTPTFFFDNPFDLPGFGESIGTGGFQPVAFLDQMLADPMIRLVMTADGVSEADLRHLYWSRAAQMAQTTPQRAPVDDGSGPCPGSPRPGIGE
ncbi:hypothetical protein [Mameliella alba]|uniref:Uncharacterized protein n=1 Tax=Mameliella alba TaxID=561184 RepID=A0A0B3SL59_9RHOB|nr:hypothetical protein [Mameliella alba]KHQ51289.1 hypothetical protein OA50_04070 [Mameliella alba]MBY6121462.1 hypothetical protein [Mameliella alba]OWV41261.1 hypothetical protein CDZ95_17905 [Mameliella alba]OWV54635.1 hypothetical protein CDZ97_23895 [Mameliella alba]